jgi:predicted amidophosphoribosyltransferase
VWLVDLLLPTRCAACGLEDAAPLCLSCAARLVPLKAPLCDRCGCPTMWPVARCRECAGRRLAFARARAVVAYEGAAVALLSSWKEGGLRNASAFAASLVVSAVARPAAEAVTYVPATRDRELWRGHNPARRLAEELAEAWSLPCVACLTRTRTVRRQRGLPLAQRRRNVAGSFRATRRVRGDVLLVDDVYTSGATATAAASALRSAGARRVEVVTFARTLRDRAPTGGKP